MTAPTSVAQTRFSSSGVVTVVPRARMKMAVPGICSEPLRPRRSSWPTLSDTNTRAITATSDRPTVLRIKTARKTLMPMRTVRFAPSSTEVRTVSSNGVDRGCCAERRRKVAEGKADRPCRAGGGGRDGDHSKRPAGIVGPLRQASQADRDGCGASPGDVGLTPASGVGGAWLHSASMEHEGGVCQDRPSDSPTDRPTERGDCLFFAKLASDPDCDWSQSFSEASLERIWIHPTGVDTRQGRRPTLRRGRPTLRR